MKTHLISLATMSLALSTSACGSLMNPDIQQNPHPKMRYDITMTIDDAPGPFDSVTGFLQYEVTNKNCAPEDPIAGVTVTPSTNPPFVFARVSDNVYMATVYADLIKDEDYFGKGVCHWSLMAVIGELHVHGTTFRPDITSKEMATNEPSTLYFWKDHYVKAPLEGYGENGVPLSVYNKAKDRNKFFSITMTAKESFE